MSTSLYPLGPHGVSEVYSARCLGSRMEPVTSFKLDGLRESSPTGLISGYIKLYCQLLSRAFQHGCFKVSPQLGENHWNHRQAKGTFSTRLTSYLHGARPVEIMRRMIPGVTQAPMAEVIPCGSPKQRSLRSTRSRTGREREWISSCPWMGILVQYFILNLVPDMGWIIRILISFKHGIWYELWGFELETMVKEARCKKKTHQFSQLKTFFLQQNWNPRNCNSHGCKLFMLYNIYIYIMLSWICCLILACYGCFLLGTRLQTRRSTDLCGRAGRRMVRWVRQVLHQQQVVTTRWWNIFPLQDPQDTNSETIFGVSETNLKIAQSVLSPGVAVGTINIQKT